MTVLSLRDIKNFFRGHVHTGIRPLDRSRDWLAKNSFSWMSGYLKARPGDGANSLILNTCSFSPVLPTISHFADWSFHRYGFTGNLNVQPSLVFVKGESNFLIRFYGQYLPLIDVTKRFVLVTGDTDCTLPRQCDQRFPAHDRQALAILESIHDDQRLIHWYAQNLDESWPKMSPIPLGFWENGGTALYRNVLHSKRSQSIKSRQLKVLCAHRLRSGPQWMKREMVTKKALDDWRDVVDYRDEIPASQFFDVISQYPFVMCVGGGGLDPSPKAWTALMAGCIPIIEVNETTKAYRNLPVVYINNWQTLELNPETLRAWLEALSPQFDQPDLRRAVLDQLSMGYWLQHIKSAHTGIGIH